MTVNERLVAAGLLDDFDQAAYANNESKMRAVLAKVDLGEEAGTAIVEWVRTSPHSTYRKSHGGPKRVAIIIVLALAVTTALLVILKS